LTRHCLAYLALAAIAVAIYWPALQGEFLWDDTDWIVNNEALRSWSGLWRIWFEPGAVIQYYPLCYTSWWLDYQFWGLSPTALHLENVLLHAGNALLFGSLLRRLGLPGASLAALVFVVHPVHVESVAWIVERKNTLSTAFFLGTAHAWLSYLDDRQGRRLWVAMALFTGALLAKTATLMLPIALFAIAIWRAHAWRGIARSLAPFAILSLLAATITVVMEHSEGASGHDWALTAGERLALFGQNVGFYAGKLLLPVQQSFVYAKWDIDASSMVAWLPTVALGIALLWSLRARHSATTAASLALWLFVTNLLPVSGLVDFYYLRYAFAADHFLYLPSLAPIALVCCGGAWLLRQKPRGIGVAVAASLTITLGTASWQRAHLFTDMATLWHATIEVEPDAWLAHTNLGNLLALRGNPDDGIEHHRRAVAIYPDAFESNNALGNYLTRHGDYRGARQHFEHAQSARPDHPLTCNNLGVMAASQGKEREARDWFRKGHEKDPDNRDLLRNYSQLLSQATDPALRNGRRALRLARQLNAVDAPSLLDQFALFRALLLGGDRGEAIALGKRVRQRAVAEQDNATAQRVGRQLERLGH
jgi:Tfp pilus assembly protein PilF